MDPAARRLEILHPHPHVGEPRAQPVADTLRFLLASQWKLGEARFSAVEAEGRVQFHGADDRPLGPAFAFTLAELRLALANEHGARRAWLRTQRRVVDVAHAWLEGELVALRIEENAAHTELRIEFLVPLDQVRSPRPAGPGRFSL